ncbi:MAG: hypothetical protein NTY23_11830 [Chloroflexi bacterium]|nr:hypothetical protein [Chloroflexota bacterium]
MPALDLGLTLLRFVGMINAFNFVDSMDDLALGLAGIASAFFMLVTIDSAQPLLSLLESAVGLYLYNAPLVFVLDSHRDDLGDGLDHRPTSLGID